MSSFITLQMALRLILLFFIWVCVCYTLYESIFSSFSFSTKMNPRYSSRKPFQVPYKEKKLDKNGYKNFNKTQKYKLIQKICTTPWGYHHDCSSNPLDLLQNLHSHHHYLTWYVATWEMMSVQWIPHSDHLHLCHTETSHWNEQGILKFHL